MLKIPVVNHLPGYLRRQFLNRTHFCVLWFGLFFGRLNFNFFILCLALSSHKTLNTSLCTQLTIFTVFSPIKPCTVTVRLMLLLPFPLSLGWALALEPFVVQHQNHRKLWADDRGVPEQEGHILFYVTHVAPPQALNRFKSERFIWTQFLAFLNPHRPNLVPLIHLLNPHSAL